MMYNWQQPEWPEFKFDLPEVEDLLFSFAQETGHMNGLLKAMPDNIQADALLYMMVAEAIKTSEIEGEYLNRQDVISSIRNNLGMNKTPDDVKDKNAAGAGELMVAVHKTYALPLTEEILFSWHKMLLPGNSKINKGVWRTHSEPMQVISGAIGREKIHFEAPPSAKVPAEMRHFIRWFNKTAPGEKNEIKKAPVRSAIAHLYFESIHPFEDGNGRMGRAIAEKALSQTMGQPVMLSLSQTIEADKKSYYLSLEKAQRSNEITEWINYFVRTIYNAAVEAKKLIEFTLKKTIFFDRYKDQFNIRQLKVLRKMLNTPEFEGGMTAKKYISITRASKATATRDLQLLADSGVFVAKGGGRSTHYMVNI